MATNDPVQSVPPERVEIDGVMYEYREINPRTRQPYPKCGMCGRRHPNGKPVGVYQKPDVTDQSVVDEATKSDTPSLRKVPAVVLGIGLILMGMILVCAITSLSLNLRNSLEQPKASTTDSK